MTTMKEKTHCAWCLRELNKKSIGLGIGPECKKHLPEILNVAICNRSEHAYHDRYGEFKSDSETAFKYFGDEVDLLFMISNDDDWSGCTRDTLECETCRWECYLRWEGEIHLIDIRNRWDIDEIDWTEINAEMRRKVSVMCSPHTSTRINLHWVDSELGLMMNRAYYNGPYPIGMNIEEYAEFRWNGGVEDIPICYGCDMVQTRNEEQFELENNANEIRKAYELFKNANGNLRFELYERYVEFVEAHTGEDIALIDEWMKDITKDPMNKSEAFIGGPQHYDDVEASECFLNVNIVQAGELEWDSEYGRKVFEHILLPFLLQNLPLAFENDWKSSEALTHYEFTLNGIHALLESRLEEDACVGGAWDLMQLEIVGALQNDLNRMYPDCGW